MSNWTISTTLEINYSIIKSDNLFNVSNIDLLQYLPNKKSLIVIDQKVNSLYGKLITDYFNHHSIQYKIVVINGIETEKNLINLDIICQAMDEFGINRKGEPVIGIGGGVISDLVGLAATLYRRGIPYIRIPTTLLGLVDVSVAAKTGINFQNKRNRLGSYYPPIATFLDKSFVKTLPSIEVSSGMGEILKMAVIKDQRLFELLEVHGDELLNTKFDHPVADEAIDRAIQGMKEELETNLWEKNLKRCVDFGHSFSPLIEMNSLSTNNPLTHGQAVTLDVIFSSIISNMRGLLSQQEVERIVATAKKMGLPTFHPAFTDTKLLLESLTDTMKHRNGDQNLPTPVKIGSYIFIIKDLTFEEIQKAAKLFGQYGQE